MTTTKTAMLRALRRSLWGEPGKIFWAPPDRARDLIQDGTAKIACDEAFPAGDGVLRRIDWPLNRFSVVAPVWRRKVVACIGGGPSVTMAQVTAIRAAGIPTIAINDAYLLAPWADLNFFCDAEWWKWHWTGIAKPRLGLTAADVKQRFVQFAGEKCSISNSAEAIEEARVHILWNAGDIGVSQNAGEINTGRNGGYMALNIAALARARIALCVGFDGGWSEGGESHFHDGHPRKSKDKDFAAYREAFRQGAGYFSDAGLRVINCSPGTRITAFEQIELQAALALAP